jgi:hypothetical protein
MKTTVVSGKDQAIAVHIDVRIAGRRHRAIR